MLYHTKKQNQGVIFFTVLCLLSCDRGEILSSPQCMHPHGGDPSADYLQSIVIETRDGALVEIYNQRCEDTEDCWGGWGVGKREAHLTGTSLKSMEVSLGHPASRLLPHHCFSGLQCCSLWCLWYVQSAEFLMRSGQKYNASCPYSELISCSGLCRDPSSMFISV